MLPLRQRRGPLPKGTRISTLGVMAHPLTTWRALMSFRQSISMQSHSSRLNKMLGSVLRSVSNHSRAFCGLPRRDLLLARLMVVRPVGEMELEGTSRTCFIVLKRRKFACFSVLGKNAMPSVGRRMRNKKSVVFVERWKTSSGSLAPTLIHLH